MQSKIALMTGIALAGLGVAVGAFGAHALKPILTTNNRVDTFELAVRYQFYHAFAMILAAYLAYKFGSSLLRAASACFFVGVVFFSGSLYVLSLTGVTWLGAVTPVGGLLFLIGWALMFVGVARSFPRSAK